MPFKLQEPPPKGNHVLVYGLIMKCNHRRRPTVHMLRNGRFQRGGEQKQNKTEQRGRKEQEAENFCIQPVFQTDGRLPTRAARLMTQKAESEDRHWPGSQRDAFISD